jgi:RNA polymerase sigma-70 factor (ECF subfamily)
VTGLIAAIALATARRTMRGRPNRNRFRTWVHPVQDRGTLNNVTRDDLSDDPNSAAPRDEYASIVVAIAAGDTSALAELYDASVSKVHALVRSIIRNVEDAEEVTCDVYTQAWQLAAQFDAERGSVMAWLLTIARSRSLDALRRQRRRERLIDDAAPTQEVVDPRTSLAPDHYLNLFQLGTVVHSAMSALPPDRRALVGMAFFDDLTQVEIANHTGLPLGTVKSHLRRALHTLRDSLYPRDEV